MYLFQKKKKKIKKTKKDYEDRTKRSINKQKINKIAIAMIFKCKQKKKKWKTQLELYYVAFLIKLLPLSGDHL